MGTGSVWFHWLLWSRAGPRLRTQTTPPLWREPCGICSRRWAHPCSQRREQLPRAGACGWQPPPRPVVPCICDVRETCMVSVLFSLLRSLCLKFSGSLRPAGMILNTLVIFGAWLFTQSCKHHLWFQGWGCPKSLFQNQLVTSAPLIYALQTSEAIFKTGFLSVYARGCNPSSLPPQVKQYGQFSHISTCITLCTSHNWSMTVTGYIRCFFYILFTQILCD